MTKTERAGSEGCAKELTEKEFNRREAADEKRWLFWLNQRREGKKRRAGL